MIAVIDAELATIKAISVSADGASKARERRMDLIRERSYWQAALDRVNGTSPMFVRGHVGGMR